jgi:hypothetical protein
MGAALTYARRVTLVGIAGEDELDAPAVRDRRPIGSGQALGGARYMTMNNVALT